MELLRETLKEYGRNGIGLYTAALSFYTVFALGPLMFLLLYSASVFFPVGFRSNLTRVFEPILGEGTEVIVQIVENYTFAPESMFASVVGFVFIIFASTRLFAGLQAAMNAIWEGESVQNVVRRRVLALNLIVITGLVIIGGLGVELVLQSLVPSLLLGAVPFLVGFALTCVIFVAVYKLLPHRPMPWRHAVFAALVTTVFLAFGQPILSVVLRARYGVSNAVIATLVWVYYSWWVVLTSAQWAKVFMDRSSVDR